MKKNNRIPCFIVLFVMLFTLGMTNALGEKYTSAPKGLICYTSYADDLLFGEEQNFEGMAAQYKQTDAVSAPASEKKNLIAVYDDYEAPFSGKLDLAWLSAFPDMEYLNIGFNVGLVQIDWQSIPNKQNVKGLSVYLSQQAIDDLSFLKDFPNLEVLDVSVQTITSIAGLETVPHLRALGLFSQYAIDLQWGGADLQKAVNMSQIEKISLFGLDLKKLNLFESCNHLKMVELLSCAMDDYSWAKHNPDLSTFVADGTPIKNMDDFSDCQALKDVQITNVKQFNSIQGLQGKSAMECLTISDTSLKDISVVADMPDLWEFCVYRNKTSPKSFNVLENHSKLGYVFLVDNKLTTIDFLASSKNIQLLDIQNNKIKDISIVADMKKLSFFECKNNKIKDFSPLEGLNISYCNTK